MFDYLESISSDSTAFADVIASSALDADVASCPGWNLRDLAHHLGRVQRWARLAAVEGRQPDAASIDGPPDDDELAAWLRSGSTALVAALGGVAPDAPTWHPFPVAKVAAVWPRRQAHEVAVHLWDAQSSVGTPTPMNPALAADFVREYFEVIVPRVMDKDGRMPPIGLAGIELTDIDEEFAVRSTGARVEILDAINDGEMISGRAEDVLLALWRRQPLAVASTSAVAAKWLEFGGN